MDHNERTKTACVQKTEIESHKANFIPLDNTGLFGKIIIETSNSTRRVEEKCEVKFFLQKYICLKEEQVLKIFNKDFKNICKRSIEKMTNEELQIRKCLLNLFDSQVVWFIVHKDIDPKQFSIALKELKVPKEDEGKYEENLYYKFFMESIVYPQPAEPKTVQSYDKYIKKYQEEIRYFISKESYTEGEKWANSIISRFFNMSKELRKTFTEKIKKTLQPEFKTIILNKTLCLMKKVNDNKKKDYEQVIQCIENEYYKNFPDDKDGKYIKISVRLAKCLLEIRDLDKSEKVLKELNVLIPQDPIVGEMQKELLGYRKQVNQKSKMRFENYSQNNDDYEWAPSVTDPVEYLKSQKIDKSILCFLGN